MAISGLSFFSNESRSPTAMAEVLPQIRVRAATQSRDAGSKMEPPSSQPLKDATNGTGNGRIILPESAEGETPSQLPGFSNIAQPYATNSFREAANNPILARQLPATKSYPSKFMQSLSGSQANAASRSPASEERRDSQAIDPLSHVRLMIPCCSD